MTFSRLHPSGLALGCLWFLTATAALSAADPDPRELLKLANAAAAGTHDLHYRFRYFGPDEFDGAPNPQAACLYGEARVSKGPVRANHRFRVSVQGSLGADDPPGRVEFATDGRTAWRADHRDKSLVTQPAPRGGRALLRDAGPGLPSVLVDPSPFALALASGTLSWGGVEDIGGVPCDVIRHVEPLALGERETHWYLGREDRLPRAQIQIDRIPGVVGRNELRIFDLEANAKLAPDVFRPRLPTGFEARRIDKPVLSIGKPAPEWQLTGLDGEPVALEQFRGRTVLLYFWSSTCSHCRAIQPLLVQFAAWLERRPETLIGIHVWEPGPDHLHAHLARQPLKFPVLLDGDAVAASYGVFATPSLVVVGPDGELQQLLMPVTETGLHGLKIRLSGQQDRMAQR